MKSPDSPYGLPETPYPTGMPREDGKTVYDTASGPVAISLQDSSYKPSEVWLESQRRQSEAGGPFASEVLQERILELVGVFRQFEYDRYATPQKYAKKWGYTVRYTRLLCTEALKLVREEVTDAEYVTVTVCEALDKVIRDNIRNPKVGNQKLVVQAAKVWAEIAGVRAPVEVRLSRGPDADLPSDPNELRRLAAALAAAPGSSLRELRLTALGSPEILPADTEKGVDASPETPTDT